MLLPPQPSMDLREQLESLGLGQYFAVFTENGFDDWDTLLDITEEDLHDLDVKLGHRRILQREIASRRAPATMPDSIQSPPGDAASPPAVAPQTIEAAVSISDVMPAERRPKRRYRWHPRPDPNAPKRPKTAYVNFADRLRADPTIANMSFVEIAREVGRQWQVMDATTKQKWETQAAAVMQEYEEQMEMYRRTETFQEYQQYLESFKKAPGKTARQKLTAASSSETMPRSSQSESVDSIEGDRVATVVEFEDPADRLRQDCDKALFSAMAELNRLGQEYGGLKTQGDLSIPPEELSRKAVQAMFDGVGSLLYLFDKEQAEEVLRAAYQSPTEPEPLLFVEVCAMSAIGGHYDSRQISNTLTRRFVVTALTLLDSVVISDDNYLRVMRVLCCLAVYSLLEKHLSARPCVAAGLAIACWKYPQLGVNGDSMATRESWRKIYRTLVFLECWICYTLGYRSENIHIHIKYSLESVIPQDSVENAIQHQAAKLAVLAAEISYTVQQSNQISAACMEYIIGKLDYWQHELPTPLQLIGLISGARGNLSPSQGRAMFMVHILYLGAVILLYRQLVVTADEDQQAGQWTLGVSQRELHKYQAGFEMAAQQIARVLIVMDLNGYCTLRCWLITYWSFSACAVLLYRAGQDFRDGKLFSVDDLLTYSNTCIQMLRICSNEEPIAVRYLSMLEPAFETLYSIRLKLDAEVEKGKRTSQPKISISALLEPTPSPTPVSTPQGSRSFSPQPPNLDPKLREDARKIVAYIGALLKDSFGRMQQSRHTNHADVPYPSPPLSETSFWFR